MVIIFIVLTASDECEQDVICQVGLRSRSGANYVVVTCDTKTFTTVTANKFQLKHSCLLLSFFNKFNFPDFPHPPHLHVLSETASRITSEVEITNDDGLIHRDLLVLKLVAFAFKKAFHFTDCFVFAVVFTMLYLTNCFACVVVLTMLCIPCILFVVCEIYTEIVQFLGREFVRLVHRSSVDLFG